MKRKFKKAYTALKKIGAPVFENEDMERDGNFGLSAEDNVDRVWADYYREFGWPVDGIDAEVLKIVDKNGLYFEWQNPGVLYAYEK
jgi:hypothetical protein